MTSSALWTASALADAIGGRLEGDGELPIRDVAPLEEAGPSHLTFAQGERNEARAVACEAGCVIVRDGVALEPSAGRALIRHAAPQAAFARAVALVRPAPPLPAPGVHPSAVIDPKAHVAGGAAVGPLAVIEAGAEVASGAVICAHAYVGARAKIGPGAVIHPHATVAYACEIGARSIVHPGAVIGSDGFGYTHDPQTGAHLKVPQVGRVVLEEDVEIGANTTIDRAALTETRIGRGTKVDNLVQIAHNVRIGPFSIVIAQAGISGSTEIGAGVIVAAQAGVVGHIKIGDRAVIGASAGVTKDVAPGAVVLGQPAIPAAQAKRALALFGRLPDMWRALKRIEKLLGAKPDGAASDADEAV